MGEIINTNTAIETQPGGDTGAFWILPKASWRMQGLL